MLLGERGESWREANASDYNRHLVANTPYADWYDALYDAPFMSHAGKPELRTGTAGWSIPSASAADFPELGTSLERYSALMSAVEINSSFHRPHRRTTYERWAASVPADFRFAVKAPKVITHVQRLINIDEPLALFLNQVGGLGTKLGVVLIQLPPKLAFDLRVVSNFLQTLRQELKSDVAIACEPRHASWSGDDASNCLVDFRVTRVLADPVLLPNGDEPDGWQGLRYYRWHGSPRPYYSAYEDDRLIGLAKAMTGHQEAGIASWAIFDNTAAGHATNDAARLTSAIAAIG